MEESAGAFKRTGARLSAAGCLIAWLGCAAALGQMTPTPELGVRLQARIDAFNEGHTMRARVLKAVYFTLSDREPLAGHSERLMRIMSDIQSFYREEMKRNAFPESTPLPAIVDRLI